MKTTLVPEGRWLVRGLYVLTVAVPLALTSARPVLLLQAGLGLASAGVAAVVYDHAFTSVWCLFSAVLSASIAWAIRTTPVELLAMPRQVCERVG